MCIIQEMRPFDPLMFFIFFYNAANVAVCELRILLQVTEYLSVVLSNYSLFLCSRGDLINVTFIIFFLWISFLGSFIRTVVWNKISKGSDILLSLYYFLCAVLNMIWIMPVRTNTEIISQSSFIIVCFAYKHQRICFL